MSGSARLVSLYGWVLLYTSVRTACRDLKQESPICTQPAVKFYLCCCAGNPRSAARNSGRVGSVYSTDSKDSGDSTEKRSDGPIIELNQQV